MLGGACEGLRLLPACSSSPRQEACYMHIATTRIGEVEIKPKT